MCASRSSFLSLVVREMWGCLLQCVATCCSVLQSSCRTHDELLVVTCCSVLQCLSQRVAACCGACSVLQCVVARCSVFAPPTVGWAPLTWQQRLLALLGALAGVPSVLLAVVACKCLIDM